MQKAFFMALIGYLIYGPASAQSFISCSQGPGLSTFVLRERADSTTLNVHHAQGVDKTVIHSGEITPSDFAFLKKKAEIFKKMGQSYQLSFDKDNCLGSEHGQLHCYINNPLTINKLKVDALSFYLTPRRIQSSGMDFNQYHVGVEVRIGGQVYNALQSFYDSDCQF